MSWEVWGIQPIPQEEGVTPLLGPQLYPIDCGRQHSEPGRGICRSSHLTFLQDRGPLQCRRQHGFRLLFPPVPHGQPSPPKTGRVIVCPKYGLAPESCDEVSCDYTGRCPVLRSRLDLIW